MHNGHQQPRPPDDPTDETTTSAAPRDRDGALDVAWDIDKTLLQHTADVEDYDDPAELERVCEPYTELVEIATGWTGHRHWIVTGRVTETYRFTLEQLHRAGFVDDRGSLLFREMHMQPEWRGMEALVGYKAEGLANLYYDPETEENVSADLYVADDEADEEAADRAGVRYIHPDELVEMSPRERAELLRGLIR